MGEQLPAPPPSAPPRSHHLPSNNPVMSVLGPLLTLELAPWPGPEVPVLPTEPPYGGQQGRIHVQGYLHHAILNRALVPATLLHLLILFIFILDLTLPSSRLGPW